MEAHSKYVVLAETRKSAFKFVQAHENLKNMRKPTEAREYLRKYVETGGKASKRMAMLGNAWKRLGTCGKLRKVVEARENHKKRAKDCRGALKCIATRLNA